MSFGDDLLCMYMLFFHCHAPIVLLYERTDAWPHIPGSRFLLWGGNLIPKATVATAEHSVNAQA